MVLSSCSLKGFLESSSEEVNFCETVFSVLNMTSLQSFHVRCAMNVLTVWFWRISQLDCHFLCFVVYEGFSPTVFTYSDFFLICFHVEPDLYYIANREHCRFQTDKKWQKYKTRPQSHQASHKSF